MVTYYNSTFLILHYFTGHAQGGSRISRKAKWSTEQQLVYTGKEDSDYTEGKTIY